MMLSKEQFCNIIQHIGLLQEQEDRINAIFLDPLYNVVQNDFVNGYSFSNPRIEQDLVDTLEVMFDDVENGWISYYIYELRCGVDWKPGMVTDKDGRDIPLGGAVDLYNLLVRQLVDDYIGGTD